MIRKSRLVRSLLVSLAVFLILGAFAQVDSKKASASGDVYSPNRAFAQVDSTKVSVSDQVYSPDKSAKAAATAPEGYMEVDWEPTPNAYWQSTSPLGAQLVTPENSTATNHKYFIASKLFSREDLPLGSIIEIDPGYQYRPDGWISINPPQAGSTRPGNVTKEKVVVDKNWWGDYQYRGFNIAVVGGTTDIRQIWQEIVPHFRIYVPSDGESNDGGDHNDGKPAFKLLAIGNSFSEDAFTYLQSMAKADGVDIKVGILYIGGSALSEHWMNASQNRAAYSYMEYKDGVKHTSDGATIDRILKSDDWDYVSLQQASHFSGIPSTYDPYLQNLENYVKTRVPNAEMLVHQTWAYEKGSSHYGFIRFQGDPDVMFNQVSEAYKLAAKKLGNVKVIPSGLAMQNARTNELFDPIKGGKSLFRDGYHANYIHGRYLLAAVWYEALTANSISENRFRPAGISDEELAVLKQEAHKAVVDYTSEPADLDLKDDLNGLLWYEGEDYYEKRPPNEEPVAILMSGERFDIRVDDLKLFGNGSYEIGVLAAGSRTTYEIELNGKSVGTLKRDASGSAMSDVTMTFLNDQEVTLKKGDIITIIAPEEDDKQVVVDEHWWGDYQYRGFNIAVEGNTQDIREIWQDVASHFRIYVPSERDNHALIEMDWEPTPNAYWQSTSPLGAQLITPENSTATNHKYFIASKLFSREDLPFGSIIEIDPGYQYRPDGWISINPPKAGPTRPGNVTSGSGGSGWVDAVVLKNRSLGDPDPTEPGEQPGGEQPGLKSVYQLIDRFILNEELSPALATMVRNDIRQAERHLEAGRISQYVKMLEDSLKHLDLNGHGQHSVSERAFEALTRDIRTLISMHKN
ncbi:hypothetical protein J31TS4_25630 [Paenibacillus sp. J31TS4]|uniref:DUF4886 domain-containing protein n=1 Tax=Paenibacillus sp. J31TS4 TaxID=2807195 RepID=UPI001B214746|nr:DUF4886 domain-containing protein [Paenibacillus sp. J31TS4]GIP39283.1 hypothetical protein J31TS4_25630 [Paenibacillus sp. J31TS4]